MLHQKVAPGTERKGSNGWVLAKEAFVVTVERDAIRPGSVVVDQTEVKRASRGSLGRTAQPIEAFWNRAGRVSLVTSV